MLPDETTPAIREVLGLPSFRGGPLAHVFRTAGADIPRRYEDEQAFIPFHFLHLALEHGAGWFKASCADVEAAVARIKVPQPAEDSE